MAHSIDFLGSNGSNNSNDNDNNVGSGGPSSAARDRRGVVNCKIAAKQAALRRQAKAVATTRGTGRDAEDAPYNYDAKYNLFSSGGEKNTNVKCLP